MLQLFTTLQAIFADRKNDEGATAIEYGLLAALIAAVMIAAVTVLGVDVASTFTTVETAINGPGNP